MSETLSVRLPEEEYQEITALAKEEHLKKSDVLREVVMRGIKAKQLELAIEKFRKHEVTAWKAARLAGLSLTEFLDLLSREGLEFYYTIDELREDMNL